MNVTFEREDTSSKFVAGVVVGLAGAAAILYAKKKFMELTWKTKDYTDYDK